MTTEQAAQLLQETTRLRELASFGLFALECVLFVASLRVGYLLGKGQ